MCFPVSFDFGTRAFVLLSAFIWGVYVLSFAVAAWGVYVFEMLHGDSELDEMSRGMYASTSSQRWFSTRCRVAFLDELVLPRFRDLESESAMCLQPRGLTQQL